MANLNAGGNARKSRARHELDGTFRKDRHADLRNPEPSQGQPDRPDGLTQAEQDEWERMMWRLSDMRTLYKVDMAAVYQYCRLYGETERVAEQQAEAKASVEILEANIGDVTGSDLVQVFGQIVILRKLIAKATDQLRQGRMAIRQYLGEFGLTPASRGRIKLPARQDATDEFSAYQQARPPLARVK
jgi:P27 family predicted phage terminase small subunit